MGTGRWSWKRLYNEEKCKLVCEKYIETSIKEWHPSIPMELNGHLKVIDDTFIIRAGDHIELEKVWPGGYDDNLHVVHGVMHAMRENSFGLVEEVPVKIIRDRVKEVFRGCKISDLKQVAPLLRKKSIRDIELGKGIDGKDAIFFYISALRGSHSLNTCIDRLVKIKDADKIIARVAKKFGLKIWDEEKSGPYSKEDRNRRNHSSCCGNEIILGRYDDREFRLISFFHELGHVELVSSKWRKEVKWGILPIEMQCWQEGIKYAAQHCGIQFSDEAIAWGYNNALSYVNYK
jgi:hypothetical protein